MDPRPPAASAPSTARLAPLFPAFLAAAGGGLGWAWGRLPAALWWPLSLALLAAVAALALARRREQRRRAGERQRRRELEHCARQLEIAEPLAELARFEWHPADGTLQGSEQMQRLLGLPAPGAAAPGLEWLRRHLHADDAARVLAGLQAAWDAGTRYDGRFRLRRGDGSLRHVHARAEVLADAGGRPECVLGALLDETARVQAEEARRLAQFALDAVPDPVSVVDDEMNYRLTNAAWFTVTGVSRKHAGTISFDHVFPVVVSTERRQAIAQGLGSGQVHVVRTPLPPPLPQGRVLETRYVPFRDEASGRRGLAMVSRDVTEDEGVREQLAASLEHLTLTLNTIGDAIFATDALSPDEPVLFANEQLLALWCIPPEQAQPLTARTIMRHAVPKLSDPQGQTARIEQLISGNEDGDDRVELNDGRVLMRRCRAVELQHRRPVRVWAFRDITAEVQALRALADAEQRQRRLLEAFPGYIWAIDRQHRLAYFNALAAQVHSGLQPALGLRLDQIFHPDTVAGLQPSIDRALAGETLSLEWHRRLAGARVPETLLLRFTPGDGPDGGPCAYAFGIDISSLKQAEAALVAARDEAERTSRVKTQFLSNMSHELRTPLNAVLGFSQLLESNAEGNLLPAQLRQLAEIRRAGNHLLALISDLLDLARIEAGRTALALGPVPLAELAEGCLRLMQPLALRERQTLLPAAGPALAVLADPTRLKQVLLNLLSNAVKYNREGGSVGLRWRRDGGEVLIEVEDQGPGLSEESQARLFKPFERLQAKGSGTEGTGIGLALSQQLVLLMHGRIGVRSRPGEGSCFWLRLQPAAAAGDGEPSAPALAVS
ncbi:MAG: ATP-binding protein [Rubrivivax sp.]